MKHKHELGIMDSRFRGNDRKEVKCHSGHSTPSLSSSGPNGGTTKQQCRMDSRFRGNDSEKELSSSGLTRGSIGQSNHYYGFSGRTPNGVCRRLTRERELSSVGPTRGTIGNHAEWIPAFAGMTGESVDGLWWKPLAFWR